MNIKYLLSDIKSGTSHSVSYLQKDSLEKTLSVVGIKIRKLFAPLLRCIYLTQSEYKLVIDKREKLHLTAKGKIYIINHRQGDDIVLGANVVGKSAYIVFGNPYLAFETSNGLGLWAYGMILLKRNEALSRKSAYEKMKYVIEHGGNIIIYPEGYWNLDDNGQKDETHVADAHNSDNWLIQDFNIGVFRLAKEIGCEIVPAVLHYDEVGKKKCYAYRGHPFQVGEDEDIFVKKNEILTYMQTKYFYLCEKYSSYRRSDLESSGKTVKEQWEGLKNELVNACDIERIGYHLDLADEKKIGKARVVSDVVTRKEAFAGIANIEKITPQNAWHVARAIQSISCVKEKF